MIDSDCKSQSYAHLMVFNKMATKPRWLPESPPKSALQWVLICPILCESFMKKNCLVFSSADDVSSAELMVLLIVRRPSSSVVLRRPSVNFCFKSLLLLQFLFDNSEFFTGETRHIVPPCNKAGISNFCLEFQKLQKFQIS